MESETEVLIQEGPPVTEAETDAAMMAAVEDVAPVLSDEDREFLDRREAIERAAKVYEEARAEEAEAIGVADEAKRVLKAKEAAREAAADALFRAIREHEEEPPMPLFDGDKSAADANFEAAQAAWDEKWEAFLAQPVSVLELPKGLSEKIAEHEIATLKDLTATKAASEGHGYTVIPGVGKANADKIDDAYECVMAEFLKANPQPVKDAAPAETQATGDTSADASGPADYNFVDKFPAPIDPTANESYDADYHIGIRDEAIEELQELRKLKAAFDKGETVAGRPLTERGRRQAETVIGDTDLQFNDGLAAYGAVFGKAAADALRRYVEAEVDRRANLKGGL